MKSYFYNKIVQTDLQQVVGEPLDWEHFRNKSVLITGAYSMLGSYLAYLFLFLNQCKSLNVSLILLGRNAEKLKARFADFQSDAHCLLLCQDVAEEIRVAQADYIFHFAGNCSPYCIKNNPVDILRSNVMGMFRVVECARRCGSQRVVVASTREVYGDMSFADCGAVDEDMTGLLNPMDLRSCYPESKRMEETIATSYFMQYGVNTNPIRMAHIYGPGMKLENDGRVMSDFINDAVCGRDILLKSDGMAERAFCYLSDAIAGILYVTLNGEKGAAYNLSNETEPLSIREVAQRVCQASGKQIKVRIEPSADNSGYCKYKRTSLDNSRIAQLGFSPKVTLDEGLRRTICFYNSHGR